MIPQTVGTVLAFLGLVAPALAFELLRERRRPALSETTFREASRIALSSLVFTTIALAVLLAIRAPDTSLVADPSLWLARGNDYLKPTSTWPLRRSWRKRRWRSSWQS